MTRNTGLSVAGFAVSFVVIAACGAGTSTPSHLRTDPHRVHDARNSERSSSATNHVHCAQDVSRLGMVVSDEAKATAIGCAVLAAGGNAADAAVATAFALAVSFPTAGNIGGGGFAVTRTPSGNVDALDFRETAPLRAHRDMYLGADGQPTQDARLGIRSAAVPASVAGLWALYERLGSKRIPWASLVAPAVALARDGFEVDDGFLATLASGREVLMTDATSRALFFPGGAPPAAHSVWKNPELGDVLSRIAEHGPKGFYEGPTARMIAKHMEQEGGLVTLDDLASYRPVWRRPIEFSYRGFRFASMPPPSSGGITLAMMAHILEPFDLRSLGFQSPAHLHTITEAMRVSFAARNARLGDPDFVSVPVDELLSDSWAAGARSLIKPDRATPSSEVSALPESGAGPHTTHLSVVDADGGAVALTTTINGWFGSGVTVKGAGFLLNNEMDDFAAVPGRANAFGLVQGEANAIAPKKRMLSSMSPTIVTDRDGKVRWVAGAAGGPTIITTVFQELSAVIDFQMSSHEAVQAPRFHMQHTPDVIAFEKGKLADAVRVPLEQMGYRFLERSHIADAPLIGWENGAWHGIKEPRRIGGRADGP